MAFVSSGSLQADRLYEYALAMKREGDLAGACEVMEQALERAPGFAPALQAVGELHLALGRTDEARAAFTALAAADPDDTFGARLHLARLSGAVAPMSDAYIATLFDDYAPRFDKALREGLGYKGPELLRAAVEQAAPGRHFSQMLDLGCGTGLAGEAFAPLCATMTGIDLSPGMVAKARARGLYAALEATSMEAFASTSAQRFDLMVAADVLVYVRDLEPLFAALAPLLTEGGLVAFSVQEAREGVAMGEDLRFSHSRATVEQALAATGFATLSLTQASTRREKGVDVPGLVVVATKP